MEEKFCPCCGRHCSLDSVSCGRGEEFLKTGVIPGRGEHCHGGRCGHREEYENADVNGKLIFNIRGIGHAARAMSDGRDSQNHILSILKECGGITQSELTERLGIQPGSASEVIGKLERAGLILRAPNEKDKRTLEVKLTEEGALKAAEADDGRRERQGSIFACLTEEEKEQLLALLEKVNGGLRKNFGGHRGGGEHGEGHCGRRGEGRHGRHGEGHGGHRGGGNF